MSNVITEFSPEVCVALKKELLAAMQSVLDKHGVAVTPGNGRYSASSYSLKLDFVVKQKADGTKVANLAELDYQRYAAVFGCRAEWLGQTFKEFSGREFKIVGLLPKKRKAPIVVEEIGRNGKQFVMPAHNVAGYMKGGV